MLKSKTLFFLLAAVALLASCKGGNPSSAQGGEEVSFKYATNLKMTRHEGYTEVRIRNPWDTTATLRTYILVADSMPVPSPMPQGVLVRTPLKRSLVYSAVHSALFEELGGLEGIAAVCDTQYIHSPAMKARVKSGRVADCGNSMSPNIERIISLRPDAILLSPYENSGTHGKVGQMGVPVIECTDYMETTPLGRAEWMRFYGELIGEGARADSLFAATEAEYNRLAATVSGVKTRPSVMLDKLYGATWYVPARRSTIGVFIRDAGGRNPFDCFEGTASEPQSGEQVLHRAGDADVWLLRYAAKNDYTRAQLAADSDLYTQFASFRNGRVYGCNTGVNLFYDEVPFHPHLLMADLIALLHPEMEESKSHNLRYFNLLK